MIGTCKIMSPRPRNSVLRTDDGERRGMKMSITPRATISATAQPTARSIRKARARPRLSPAAVDPEVDGPFNRIPANGGPPYPFEALNFVLIAFNLSYLARDRDLGSHD